MGEYLSMDHPTPDAQLELTPHTPYQLHVLTRASRIHVHQEIYARHCFEELLRRRYRSAGR